MPGTADHPIEIEPAGRRWRVYFAQHVIADSDDAMMLSEAGYPPVLYFPREDVGMDYLARTERHTRCPYKGEASYFTIMMDGEIVENGIWSYEEPIPGMEAIAGRVAFDQGKGFEVYPVDEARVNPDGHVDSANVDEVVLHTDAGDGTSQREHWPPNVDGPPRDGGTP